MKVLIIGHGCNPLASSEPGLTWNWAFHMARTNTVHLLSYPHARLETERFMADHPCPSLNVHWVDAPHPLARLNQPGGEKGIRLHYLLWLRKAMERARELHGIYRFDLVHHVGWGTVSVPTPFWKLGIPLVWGPLGGGQTPPQSLLPLFGSERWKEMLRTLRVKALPFWPALRKAVQRSAVLLATNPESERVLRSAGAERVTMLTDSALREDYLPSVPPNRTGQSRIRVLWASKLLRWKGVDLALRAMQQLGEQSGVHLVIAGGGPLTGELEATIKTLGLQHSVTAKGPVPWRDMPDEFSSADVFLFTSVRDSFGSVILEAAAHRLPIIHLNLGGAGAALPSDAGIKIQPSTVKATAESIAKALAYMRDHPDARARMGQAAYDFAKANLWPRHASIMQEIYRECAASGGQR